MSIEKLQPSETTLPAPRLVWHDFRLILIGLVMLVLLLLAGDSLALLAPLRWLLGGADDLVCSGLQLAGGALPPPHRPRRY
ncbi:MAG: hypothetical protein HC876_10765 [Chloroflexaceae bacterium]|nr:hypothetical protein [Chloroflexaceae bacterium]